MNSLAQQLRQATRPAHQRLDRLPLLRRLLATDLTLSHYRQALQTLAWLHLPLHATLTEALTRYYPTSSYRLSPRVEWLQHDLQQLQIALPTEPPPPPPQATSGAMVVGQIYVVEGSTLGGAVIAQAVARSLTIGPHNGGAFLHGHGAESGEAWQRFWRFAETSCPAHESEDAVIGACKLFDYMGYLLGEWDSGG